MNDKWKAENFDITSWANRENASGGFVWVEDFLPDKFKLVEYGNLFAYMYRRFGIPQFGSDDHKEIANWYITTPDPAVALRVSPRPSGVNHSFGYVIDQRIYDNWQSKSQVNAVQKALSIAISDLLTPVFVRDVPINAIGRVKRKDALDNACDEWKWAGYGVSIEYFEKEYG